MDFSGISNSVSNLFTPTKDRSDSLEERNGELTTDSLPDYSNLPDHSQQLPPTSQSASPLSMNAFLELFNQQKDMLQQMQTQILELKEAKSQVTDVDGLRRDLRQFCAELQQTHKAEMGLEVERQVSMQVAPLQQELDAVKVELQQLRGKVESSPASTSQQQSQPNVSELETKVQWIEQATMQQADQTDRAARQWRAKNAVLRNFRQAENEPWQPLPHTYLCITV